MRPALTTLFDVLTCLLNVVLSLPGSILFTVVLQTSLQCSYSLFDVYWQVVLVLLTNILQVPSKCLGQSGHLINIVAEFIKFLTCASE